MNNTQSPVEYSIEIYCGECVFQSSSLKPFQTISAGDFIDPRGWETNQIENNSIYRATKIIHLLTPIYDQDHKEMHHTIHCVQVRTELCARKDSED